MMVIPVSRASRVSRIPVRSTTTLVSLARMVIPDRRALREPRASKELLDFVAKLVTVARLAKLFPDPWVPRVIPAQLAITDSRELPDCLVAMVNLV